MANIEGMGNKFVVIKRDDIDKYLGYDGGAELYYLVDVIEQHRQINGKKFNTYVAINTDEEYADVVIELMKKHGHWG